MDVISLFPTALGRTTIGRNLTLTEVEVLEKLETRPNRGNIISQNAMVLDLPELCHIKEFIMDNVNEYFKNVISPKDNVTPYITLSWTNITKTNEYHHKHTHGNSIISGVFYVKAKPDVDSILFYMEQSHTIEFVTKDWNIWNSPSWEIPVATGDLLLFPSNLNHEVKAIDAVNHERLSLAFNVFVKGILGHESMSNRVEIR